MPEQRQVMKPGFVPRTNSALSLKQGFQTQLHLADHVMKRTSSPLGEARQSLFQNDDEEFEDHLGKKDKTWVMDYTGHVPHIRQTYGLSGFRAVETLKNILPPAAANLKQIDYLRSSRRKIVFPKGFQMLGTGFTGASGPIPSDSLVQGTRVNVNNYYEACESQDYQNLPIKSGHPAKNKSGIQLGDQFYYAGRHMYETTHKEAFNVADQAKEETPFENELMHKYAVAKAIVGRNRMDELEGQISEKIIGRVAGGRGMLRRMFAIFDRTGTGQVSTEQFMDVCKSLGVVISQTEATALFGRFDINGDGSMSYYEFLDAFLKETPIDRDEKYY